MNGRETLDYLKDLCQRMDERISTTIRKTVVTAALPVAASFSVACYAAPPIEPGEYVENSAITCSDGVDNDEDGAIDCDDDECTAFCVEQCGDAVDNDGDGAIDCDDDDCSSLETCLSSYDDDTGVLLGSCLSGLDEDENGLTDCDDPSCASGEACQGDDACADGIDNDGDGYSDCDDPDCGRENVCD